MHDLVLFDCSVYFIQIIKLKLGNNEKRNDCTVFICVHVYVCACVYVCVFVCVCVRERPRAP